MEDTESNDERPIAREVEQPDHRLRCGYRNVTVIGLPEKCDHAVDNPDCEHYS